MLNPASESSEIDNTSFSSNLQYKKFNSEIVWTIDCFLEWVKNRLKKTQYCPSEKSPPFRVQVGSVGVLFLLQLNIDSEDKEYISLYLKNLGFDDVELNCTMMAVDKKGVPIVSRELNFTKFTVKFPHGGIEGFWKY
jgi:hypothetical protein